MRIWQCILLIVYTSCSTLQSHDKYPILRSTRRPALISCDNDDELIIAVPSSLLSIFAPFLPHRLEAVADTLLYMVNKDFIPVSLPIPFLPPASSFFFP
jgi:hypothetical protein